MSEEKLVFTLDTNILYNLIFNDIADSAIVKMYNDIQVMDDIRDIDGASYRLMCDLYDRPYYEMLKGLIKDGKVAFKISPIVYSEMMFGEKLDEYVETAIDETVKNNGTLITPNMISQIFNFYIEKEYGSLDRFKKKFTTIESVMAIRNSVLGRVLSGEYSSNPNINETRRELKTIIKRSLINNSLKKLGGDISFLTLPQDKEGSESSLRADIYSLSEDYRTFRGNKDEDKSMPSTEINDSLIMAVGAVCNIPVVTHDLRGLISSRKHIASCNKKFSKKGRRVTGQPSTLAEFIDTYFPEYVVEFSKTYKPNPKLDYIDTNGHRQRSMDEAVKKATIAISRKKGVENRNSALFKQMKGLNNAELVDVSRQDFFDLVSSDNPELYSSTEGAVNVARSRQFKTFADKCAELKTNIEGRLSELHNMLFSVEPNKKGVLKSTYKHTSESALALHAQELYRDLFIFTNYIVKKLNSAFGEADLKDYKECLDKLGITLAPTSTLGNVCIEYQGIRFCEDAMSKKDPKPINMNLSKFISDEALLLCLVIPETRDKFLGDSHKKKTKKKALYRLRYDGINNKIADKDHRDYMYSFDAVTSITIPENQTTLSVQSSIDMLSGKVRSIDD